MLSYEEWIIPGFDGQIKAMLENALKRSRTERQSQNLKQQGILCIGIFCRYPPVQSLHPTLATTLTATS